MTLYKTNFPDGFVSGATPAVTSIVAYLLEIFELNATNISTGTIVLSVIPDNPVTVTFTWNGVTQYAGATRDYTVASNIITINPSLLAHMEIGDLVQVTYQ